MTTKVSFDKNERALVKYGTLAVGSGFNFDGKLYLKLEEGHSARVKGSEQLSDFGIAQFHNSTIVEPLDVDIKFSRK